MAKLSGIWISSSSSGREKRSSSARVIGSSMWIARLVEADARLLVALDSSILAASIARNSRIAEVLLDQVDERLDRADPSLVCSICSRSSWSCRSRMKDISCQAQQLA